MQFRPGYGGQFVLYCLLCLAGNVHGDKYEVGLYKYLMDPDRYEPAIRPTPHHRLSTNVTFGFLLHQVINVDEKNQQLTTSSWMNVNWMDHRLRWNHTEWKELKLLHIPHHKVWRPDIILTNNANAEYKDAAVSTDVFVTSDGNVTWLYFAIYQSSCQIRVRFYPFDDQECSMTFASWSHDGNDVNLLLLTEEGDLSNYVNSSEWQMISMTAHRRVLNFSVGQGPWPVITVTIRLGRRPLFYVFNHILPCVLISIMSMLGFYIPAETGEKVTMCITTMLSMGVFLKTITESMPPTSEAVPLIGMYYGVSLFIVCAATMVNVVTLNVHNRGYKNTPTPIPPWARKYILGYMAHVLCIAVYPADSQMVHLAERRRQLANDEELLTETALKRSYAGKLGSPVLLTGDLYDTTSITNCQALGHDHTENEGLRVVGNYDHQLSPPKTRKSAYNNPVLERHPNRGSYRRNINSSWTTTSKGRKVSSFSHQQDLHAVDRLRVYSMNSSGPSCTSRKTTSPSIYDYDYELEALRRLNSQANLMTGALSLMHTPLRATKSASGTTNGRYPPDCNNVTRPRKTTDLPKLHQTDLDSSAHPMNYSTRLGDDLNRGQEMSNENFLKAHLTDQPGQNLPTCPATAEKNGEKESWRQILNETFEEKFRNVLSKVNLTLEQNELRMGLQEERNRIMWEWKQLAIIIDRLLLLLFVLATTLTTFLILFEPIIFENKFPDEDDVPPVI